MYTNGHSSIISCSGCYQNLEENKQAGAELSQAQAGFPAKHSIWNLCLELGLSYADLDKAIISCSLNHVD